MVATEAWAAEATEAPDTVAAVPRVVAPSPKCKLRKEVRSSSLLSDFTRSVRFRDFCRVNRLDLAFSILGRCSPPPESVVALSVQSPPLGAFTMRSVVEPVSTLALCGVKPSLLGARNTRRGGAAVTSTGVIISLLGARSGVRRTGVGDNFAGSSGGMASSGNN